MIAEIRQDAQKARDFVLLTEVFQLLRQREVGEAITIVSQKFLLSIQISLYCLQSLADIRIDPSVRERNAPVVSVAIKQLYLLASTGQDKIVRGALTIIEEILLDCIGAVAQAQDEILVSGNLRELADDIERMRKEAKARKGWIMDTYLLRRISGH